MRERTDGTPYLLLYRRLLLCCRRAAHGKRMSRHDTQLLFSACLAMNRALQEINNDEVKVRTGSSRRVHRHAWSGTSTALARTVTRYKARA